MIFIILTSMKNFTPKLKLLAKYTIRANEPYMVSMLPVADSATGCLGNG